MKTTLLRLTNYKGLENLELQFGAVTVITGGNGVGKSTILDAFRSLSEGGSEPENIHIGAEEAIIKLVVEIEPTDTIGYEPGRYDITRTIRKDGYSLVVKNPKNARIGKEKTFVEKVLPKLGFDPVAFDKMTDEQRADVLKDFLKVQTTAAEIRKAAGLVELGPIAENVFEDGIGAITQFEEKLKKEASEIRAVVKNLGGSITTFQATLDTQTAEDVAAELQTCLKQAQDSEQRIDQIEAELVRDRVSRIEACAKVHAEQKKRAADEFDAAVEKLRAERKQKEDEAQRLFDAAKDEIVADIQTQQEERVTPLKNDLAVGNSRIATLREKEKKAAEVAGARKQLEAWKKERQAKSDQLERIGIACDQLDRLRTRKMAEVKLEGMKIINGKLHIGDVLSSEVNTAARRLKWVEVAADFANQGQMIVIDNIEALTAENQKRLENQFRAAGLQLLAARVDPEGGPMRIEQTLAEQQ